jgi:hypothetical protein
LTAYSLQSRAGSVSHRQRSWDSPFGAFSSRKVSGLLPPGSPHLPFSLSLLPTPWRWAGPTGPSSWGLPFRESLTARQRVSPPSHRMLPWVLALLGCLTAGLARDFARTPLSRFARRTTNRPTHRRPRVSISPRPALSVAPWQATALAQGDPSRVLAPARSRTFGRRLPPGYVFTAHCVVHCCRLANDSWGYLLALPELPGSAEVPSFCDRLQPSTSRS